jgi:hypothetical protein
MPVSYVKAALLGHMKYPSGESDHQEACESGSGAPHKVFSAVVSNAPFFSLSV